MTPKKYAQNLYTPKKYSFFWKPQKILKFWILNPKKWAQPSYVWKYQSTPLGPSRPQKNNRKVLKYKNVRPILWLHCVFNLMGFIMYLEWSNLEFLSFNCKSYKHFQNVATYPRQVMAQLILMAHRMAMRLRLPVMQDSYWLGQPQGNVSEMEHGVVTCHIVWMKIAQ